MTKGKFREVYEQYYQDVFKVIVALTKDHAVTHDAIQEVTTQILANRELLKEIRSETFKPWFTQRVKLYIQRHVWKHKRTEEAIEHRSISLSDLLDTNEEGYHQAQPDDSPPLVEAAIKAALETLNPLEHDVILCRVFASMPWEEIRLKLDRPVPTLRSAYQRGLQKLRLYLQSVGIEGASFAGSTTPEIVQNVA